MLVNSFVVKGQGSDGATELGGGTSKTGGESGSAMNPDSCCGKEMAIHVSTDAGKRGSQGTASLRSTISTAEVGCHILRPYRRSIQR